MTKTWPSAVDELIEALKWRAEGIGQPVSDRELSENTGELPELLLMEAPPTNGWNSQRFFPGYQSMIDFLANAWPDNECTPSRVMGLVTIGDNHRPHLVPFDMCRHSFDIQATAATLLAYYEGKEKLPPGLTKKVIGWLMQNTLRMGYGPSDAERYSDDLGKKAVACFKKAILSVSDVTETPILLKIFDEKNFAYSSHCSYVVGRSTRLFCQTFCLSGQEHYNKALARIFEYRARELLTGFFVEQIGYKYELDPEETTYENIPKSRMPGALAHLSVQHELPSLDPVLE